MANTYLQRTVGTPTNVQKYTYSFWIKRCELSGGSKELFLLDGYADGSNRAKIAFNSNEVFEIWNSNAGSFTFQLSPPRKFRDTNAWYHIILSVDTTQSTASDRVKLYINGVQETSLGSTTYPSLNDANNTINESGTTFSIMAYGGNPSSNDFRLSSIMSHIHFTDGYAYDASTFGETDATTGIWKPITEPSVTYGNNGFFLKFENSGSMGLDSSGNANNFTVNGTLTQTVDTPSNVFATFNPLIYMPNIPTFENGNLYVKGHDANYCEAISTLSMPKKGKWYAEFKKIEINNSFMVGIGNTNNIIEALRTNTNISESGGGYSGGAVTIRDAGDVRQTNVSDISGFFPSSIANTNIIGLAIDLDNGAVYAHKNGTYGVISSVTGDPTSGASKTGAIDISGQAWYQNADFICFLFGNISSASKDWCQANFGNGYFSTTAVSSAGSNGNGAIFEYDVPTGYYALNTKNLATYG
jgi:hypothetical protein